MKKKVLLISSGLPYPPIGGDKLKGYNLLKILSKTYDVKLVVITDEILKDDVKAELEKYTTLLKVFTKKKYQFYLSTCKFILNSLPLQVNYYYFKDVQKYISSLFPEVDFAIPILVRTSEYLNDFNKPKFLDMVDSIGLNYQKSKDDVKSIFWKVVYNLEFGRLLEYEERCIKGYQDTFFVNKYESEYWSKFGKTTWIPNGVDKKLLTYDNQNERYSNNISFFGKMDYQPNIDAVIWFVENVLHQLDKSIKFAIVGAKPSREILELVNKYSNIEVTDFVEDPYEILYSSLLVIAPMQTGGGIQNKVLESMALGTINIISSLCAKPIIGAKDKEHFFVKDTPFEVYSLIQSIYSGHENYDNMKNNAKSIIKEAYSWDNYEMKLSEVLGSVDKYE